MLSQSHASWSLEEQSAHVRREAVFREPSVNARNTWAIQCDQHDFTWRSLHLETFDALRQHHGPLTLNSARMLSPGSWAQRYDWESVFELEYMCRKRWRLQRSVNSACTVHLLLCREGQRQAVSVLASPGIQPGCCSGMWFCVAIGVRRSWLCKWLAPRLAIGTCGPLRRLQ